MTDIDKDAIIKILVDRIAFLEQAYCQQEWRLESARIKAERRLHEIRRQEAVIRKRNREIAEMRSFASCFDDWVWEGEPESFFGEEG